VDCGGSSGCSSCSGGDAYVSGNVVYDGQPSVVYDNYGGYASTNLPPGAFVAYGTPYTTLLPPIVVP
jgi:hypothetical protein